MRITIGIVDYGAGNHVSLRSALKNLGYRCRIGGDSKELDPADVLILPGVGAFPTAMGKLNQSGLTDYLKDRAGRGRPILGICLGMQLFAESSFENGETAGLGLIPGKVVPLSGPHWHIGWNGVLQVRPNPIFENSGDGRFYFNHSFTFDCPDEYQFCVTLHGRAIAAAIQKENLVGVQFHPEKSQAVGRKLLRRMIEGLCHA